MRVLKFMSTAPGRILRGVVGLVLLALGGMLLPAGLGVLLVILGLLPLAAAIFDLCLVGPLVGASMHGRNVRE